MAPDYPCVNTLPGHSAPTEDRVGHHEAFPKVDPRWKPDTSRLECGLRVACLMYNQKRRPVVVVVVSTLPLPFVSLRDLAIIGKSSWKLEK